MRLDYLLLGVILFLLALTVIGILVTLDAKPERGLAGLETNEQSTSPADSARPRSPSEAAHRDTAQTATHEPGTLLSTLSPSLHAYPLEQGPPTPGMGAYSDPVAGGVVPLINIQGREDEFLSPNFKVKDVSASDGAPYARISPTLVNLLEVLTRLAEAPVFINSGYRHPALNANPAVGGARHSQHIAGRAADIASTLKTPGELAELALAVTDCTIGVGLGGTFLHVDLRGHLASWVYDDAVMDEGTFDDWVETLCSPEPGRQPLSFAEAARRATRRSEMDAAVFEDTLIADYRDVLATFAHTRRRTQGQGAVLLDLRRRAEGTSLNDLLSYILPDTEDADNWNLNALIRSVDMNNYFVFTIIDPNGDVRMGAMSYRMAESVDR